MGNTKKQKSAQFLRKHGVKIVSLLVAILILYYFVNIIFIKRQETVVSVLILEYTADASVLETQIKTVLDVNENQKVEIKSIDAKQDTNRAIMLTWMRAKSIDLIIGNEEELNYFAQAGYLKTLDEDGASNDFMCGLAKFDSQGKILSIGTEVCFGKYTPQIDGVSIEKPVVSLAGNAENEENAKKILGEFLKKR